MAKDKKVQFRVDEETLNLLETYSKELGLTVAGFFRYLLYSYDKKQKAQENEKSKKKTDSNKIYSKISDYEPKSRPKKRVKRE